jgi:hypothetical protein
MGQSKLAVVATPLSPATERIVISAPNLQTVTFPIRGIAPYMQAKFATKAQNAIRAKHEAGSTAQGKKVREARNFKEDFEQATYRTADGHYGIPASAFRTACIDVMRLVGFKMTLGKLSIFVEPDGFDASSGKPLVFIDGKPEMNIDGVRNATGVLDLRARPMWREWSAKVRVRFDADQFTVADVTNLMARVGMQCGIGEGRPNSRDSTGMGYGLFEVKQAQQRIAA